ncbi:hypothetical protein RFI_34947, partial [Reticulomyxa filosa]
IIQIIYSIVLFESKRSHNVGYRICLGGVVYEWFCNQECKSFVFNKTNYNTVINEEKNNDQSIMNAYKNTFFSNMVHHAKTDHIKQNNDKFNGKNYQLSFIDYICSFCIQIMLFIYLLLEKHI